MGLYKNWKRNEMIIFMSIKPLHIATIKAKKKFEGYCIAKNAYLKLGRERGQAEFCELTVEKPIFTSIS